MKTFKILLEYAIWPGLMLVSAGLVVGLLIGWTPVAAGLLLAGLLLIVVRIAAGDYTGFWQRRSTQAGTDAVVSIFSVVVILALINFLGVRYDSRVDLTEAQLLSLSPASQQTVETLSEPTEVLVFDTVVNLIDQQLLENYRRFNDNLTYRYVDPLANPQLSQEFAQEFGMRTRGQVFVRSGDRTLLVQQVTQQAPLTERRLTSRLAQLNQNDFPVVYFLQGHEEYAIDGSQAGFFEAASRLEAQNYTVAPLNFVDTNAVPPDADVLVIAGAQTALFAAEIEAVRDYLEAGGSVLILIDPQVETGLEPLMSEWGVVPENAVVIDTSGGGQMSGLGPAAPLVTEYGAHPITDAFGSGRSFYPVARPLRLQAVSDVVQTELLFSNPSSHAQPITAGEISVEPPDQLPQGPFVLGVALSRPVIMETTEEQTDGNEGDTSADSTALAQESRLVVIGNSSFATDGQFVQQLNGDVFSNSVTWLSKIDNLVLSIQPKEATNRRFNLSVQQQIWLTLLSLVVLPVAGIVSAGTLWARRR